MMFRGISREFLSQGREAIKYREKIRFNKSPFTVYEMISNVDEYPSYIPYIRKASTFHSTDT